MATELELVAHDTPSLIFNLTADGSPLDVSDDSTEVVLRVRPLRASTVQSVTCDKLVGLRSGSTVDESSPYDVAGFGGRVVANCSADLLPVGQHVGEVQVTKGGRIGTVYEMLNITVRPDL